MVLLAILLALSAAQWQVDNTLVEERIDLYDPVTMSFLGTERTWYSRDGRRLRLEITDGMGARELLFLLLHDRDGRESGAIYFEGDGSEPYREIFTYSADERVQTTTYILASGGDGERTESTRDELGREVAKRYYRADGTQYGAEEVFWNPDGTKLGWDFRYLERDERASFRYAYDKPGGGDWAQRIRSRNGEPERVEVRSAVALGSDPSTPTPTLFAVGRISTDASEASPSMTLDGRTMVFARYGSDWTAKEPYIAHRDAIGWRVEPLKLGLVYNLAIAPDGDVLVYSTRVGDERTLFRVRRTPAGWSAPENLTEAYGLVGTYPSLTEAGDLLFYNSEGVSGAGIYLAEARAGGFAPPRVLFAPPEGPPFDPYAVNAGSLLVTRCFDDSCESSARNGVWEVDLRTAGTPIARKLNNVPYAWGTEVSAALGLFIFTDGEDILALPLRTAMARR